MRLHFQQKKRPRFLHRSGTCCPAALVGLLIKAKLADAFTKFNSLIKIGILAAVGAPTNFVKEKIPTTGSVQAVSFQQAAC